MLEHENAWNLSVAKEMCTQAWPFDIARDVRPLSRSERNSFLARDANFKTRSVSDVPASTGLGQLSEYEFGSNDAAICGVRTPCYEGAMMRVRMRIVVSAGVLVWLTSACDGDCSNGVGLECPPSVVVVKSPIGERLAVRRTVQLTAEARDARGDVLPIGTFSWTSSDGAVAEVSTVGVVSGLGSGRVTISASRSGVSGSLNLRVIAADLDGITVVANDPFTLTLVAGQTSPVRARVQAALAQCTSGVTEGNFDTVERCLADARAEVIGAADPTDLALLASLALFLDHIERLLNP